MYGSALFSSLSLYGQIGLLILSVVLFVLAVAVTRVIVTGWPAVVRLMLALIVLWCFMWLSPQAYYSYYSLLSDDMPQKWVIASPPPLGLTLRVITFSGPPDLIHHAYGALGLLLMGSALWRQPASA